MMEQSASKTHAENMLMTMFKLQQKSCLTDVTIVCKDGLLYGESIRYTEKTMNFTFQRPIHSYFPRGIPITRFATPHPEKTPECS